MGWGGFGRLMAGFEVIVVDCHKLPPTLDEMAAYLEQYIVPD